MLILSYGMHQNMSFTSTGRCEITVRRQRAAFNSLLIRPDGFPSRHLYCDLCWLQKSWGTALIAFRAPSVTSHQEQPSCLPIILQRQNPIWQSASQALSFFRLKSRHRCTESAWNTRTTTLSWPFPFPVRSLALPPCTENRIGHPATDHSNQSALI